MAFHESQLQAIHHQEGPMMVLAGPGSGKTTVITHRVKYLVEQCGVEPGSILVITFTKAAAQEMRQRFEKLTEGRRLPVMTRRISPRMSSVPGLSGNWWTSFRWMWRMRRNLHPRSFPRSAW